MYLPQQCMGSATLTALQDHAKCLFSVHKELPSNSGNPIRRAGNPDMKAISDNTTTQQASVMTRRHILHANHLHFLALSQL